MAQRALMPARFLLDTNTLLYLRQNRPPQVLDRFLRLEPGEAVLSVITYGELVDGAEKSRQRSRSLESLARTVSQLPVVPLPEEAGIIYGKIRADLRARGEMIGGNDLWIAAHAKTARLILVTDNEREFRRVPDLNIQNWTV
jgi:tRNA(fMet)-specific endonuclease VapC